MLLFKNKNYFRLCSNFKRNFSLISIFKHVCPDDHEKLMEISQNEIPAILNDFLFVKKRGRVNLSNIIPLTLNVLKKINNKEFSLILLQALLMQVFTNQIKVPITMVRQQIMQDLNFLLDFAILELAVSNVNTSLFVKTLFNEIYQKFLDNFDIDKIPTFNMLLTKMQSSSNDDKKKLTKDELKAKKEENKKLTKDEIKLKQDALNNEIVKFVCFYESFRVQQSTLDTVYTFKVRLNIIIINCFKSIYLNTNFFTVSREPGFSNNFNQPFVILNENVLSAIEERRSLLTRESAWPALLPLNKWSGIFPTFNFGGALSNEYDKSNYLIHVNPNTHILKLTLSPIELKTINMFQEIPFKLDHGLFAYKTILKEDLPIQSKVKLQLELDTITKNLKILTQEERADLKRIYMEVKLKYNNENGKVSILKYKAFKNDYHLQSVHILTKKDRALFDKKLKLERNLKNNARSTLIMDRINDIFRIFKTYKIYFECFFDWRLRLYLSGWPCGFNTGRFKYFIKAFEKVKIKINKNFNF